jgi:hypothetical protein
VQELAVFGGQRGGGTEDRVSRKNYGAVLAAANELEVRGAHQQQGRRGPWKATEAWTFRPDLTRGPFPALRCLQSVPPPAGARRATKETVPHENRTARNPPHSRPGLPS